LNGPTALVLLHFQNEVLHPEGRIRVGLAADDPARADVVRAGLALLAGARARGWRVFHVRVAFRPDYADLATHMPVLRRVREIGAVREGEWGAEFLAGFEPAPEEFVLTHTRISAFQGTALEQLLHLHGVRRLVVAGVATHSVVEGTVREAADRGFAVCLAADACASANRRLHAASLESMALVAEVVPAQEALEATP